MTQPKTGPARIILRGIILPVMAGGLLLFYHNLEISPQVDQIFTLQLSKWILSGISTLTSQVPFSVAEILALLLGLYALSRLFNLVIAVVQGNEILRAFFRITDLGAVLIICFLLFWGFNYRQIGLEQSVGLSPLNIPTKELELMAQDLVLQAKTERIQAGLDDKTLFRLTGDLGKEAEITYASMSVDYPQFKNPVGRAKPMLSSKLFSYMGISGIFSPFTAEANYNNDQEDLLKGSSVLHELAHLKGVAREEEANFIAYLASRYSQEPAFRYSGTMLALINTTNRLSKVDRTAFNRVNALYNEGMRLDLTAHNKYWKDLEGELRQKAEAVNDQYLKSNGQSGGIETYEDMVSYLFALKEKTGSVNLN